MSLLSAGPTDQSAQKPYQRTKSSTDKEVRPTKKPSLLESLLKRSDISEADLEQLRDELNKKK